MNTPLSFKLAISALFFLLFDVVVAQESHDDATSVWIAVEAQWEAEENDDDEWMDRMLADGFFGWSKTSPAPRSKSSTQMWDRFAAEQGSMVAHELYPLEIVIHENTAVVHYLYSSAFRSKDGTVKTDNGRYTDILVRTEDGWKFIGWHGGDD